MRYVHLRGGVVLDNQNVKGKAQYDLKRPPALTDRKAQKTSKYI